MLLIRRFARCKARSRTEALIELFEDSWLQRQPQILFANHEDFGQRLPKIQIGFREPDGVNMALH